MTRATMTATTRRHSRRTAPTTVGSNGETPSICPSLLGPGRRSDPPSDSFSAGWLGSEPYGTMRRMELPGDVRVVDDVPTAFAALVAERAPRSIALSGAWLARKCYEELRGAPLDWPNIEVFFGDERFVPPSSEDSNEGQARRALLDHVEPR